MIRRMPIAAILGFSALLLMPLMALPAGRADKEAVPGVKRGTNFKAPDPVRELQDDLDAVLSDPAFRNAAIGAGVFSLKSDSYLYTRNNEASLLPASNVKLVSTAAALEYLGKDFRYTTSVFLDGIIKRNGEFVGNVFVRGAGDPTLSTYFYDDPLEILEQWVDTFELHGIRSIRGNLVGDDSYFDHIPWGPGWAWDDTPHAYSAQISALSFFDNQVEICISPGDSVGEPAEIILNPPARFLKIRNFIHTLHADSASNVRPQRQGLSNIIDLHGGIAARAQGKREEAYTIAVAIDNPTLFMMDLLRQALERRNITFRGRIFNSEEWGDKVYYQDLLPIVDHTSPPLNEILKIINSRSHNLCAEMLLKTVAKENLGVGSFEQGAEVLLQFAHKSRIASEHLRLVDGSGLSRQNLISTGQLIGVLRYMYRSPHATEFRTSLAVPGAEGTLQHRMTGTRTEQAVFAKTGSMSNINALSGYVYSRDNEPLAFSIIINNFTVAPSMARNLQDIFCMRLANFSRKRSERKAGPDSGTD